ncbi:MAG: CARDB domain-containing protein [bacterium]
MAKVNFFQQGQSIIGIVLVFAMIALTSGALYYYLSKQIPEVSEITKKLDEKDKKKTDEPTDKPKEEITAPLIETIEENLYETPEETESEPSQPEDGQPEAVCQNECSSTDPKKCSGNGYQVCGNYDSDNCLEWSPVANCAPNNICQNGNCIRQKCQDDTLYGRCSLAKPLYCDKGNLINLCSACGCGLGQICQTDKSCQQASGEIDLDVTYISRTPRYARYNICYSPSGYNPYLCGEQTKNDQRWPISRETVSFTAHIKNKGNDASGNFDYEWKIDGIVQDSRTIDSITSGEEITSSLNWAWQNGSHLIEFTVDKSNKISEVSENNNKLNEYSDGLQFKIHVEERVYDDFNNLLNFTGSYSFEDWVQSQMQEMRNEFSAVGINEKIRIDEIVVEPNGTLPRWGTHAPEDWNWDGRWGFETDEWPISKIQNEIGSPQGALIHEWTHQLGVIDSYNLNYDWNYVKDNKANPLCESCDTSSPYCSGEQEKYQDCVYYNPDLMGIMSGAYDKGYSLFVVGALNSHLGYRRGYYGEYLYDIPSQNQIRVLDTNANPIANAEIYFYQVSNCNSLPNVVIFSGSTDSNGYFVLPNRETASVTTETGHALRNNPFGNINIVGCNGIFLIKITAGGQTDYQWLDISMFNLAYWSSSAQSATYIINSNINQ